MSVTINHIGRRIRDWYRPRWAWTA